LFLKSSNSRISSSDRDICKRSTSLSLRETDDEDNLVTLDEDAYLLQSNVRNMTTFVFKKKNAVEEEIGDLELKVLNHDATDHSPYKIIKVRSTDTVYTALKKFIKFHPINDYNQYGLYYDSSNLNSAQSLNMSGDSANEPLNRKNSTGFWLEEDQLLSDYCLKNQVFNFVSCLEPNEGIVNSLAHASPLRILLNSRKKYKPYTVWVPMIEREMVFKFDEHATVRMLFDIVRFNWPSIADVLEKNYWLFSRDRLMLNLDCTLWSYPTASKVGLKFKNRQQKLNIFYNSKSITFRVEPLCCIFPIVFEKFEINSLILRPMKDIHS